MKRRLSQVTFLVFAIGIILILHGCASPATREAMTPQAVTLSKRFPHSVSVQTSGGSATSAVDSSNISDADLKGAIEQAIAQSNLFKSIVQGTGGDFELSVRITSLSKPIFGATFTVELETAWSLTKGNDRSVVLRKAVKSTGIATMGDALVAVTRLRLAVEAAARDNISQGLKAIAQLDL